MTLALRPSLLRADERSPNNPVDSTARKRLRDERVPAHRAGERHANLRDRAPGLCSAMTEDELVGSRVRMEALFVSWGVNEPSLAPHQSFSYVRVLLAPIYVVGAKLTP